MVKVCQSNPELEPVWGFDDTMLRNVTCFFLYTLRYTSLLNLLEKPWDGNLCSTTFFFGLLFCQDVHIISVLCLLVTFYVMHERNFGCSNGKFRLHFYFMICCKS